MSFALQSERLLLRTWNQADLPLALALWGDAAVMRYLGGAQDATWVRARLETEMRHQSAFGFQYWPMFLREGGAFAGCAGLKPYGEDPAVLEVGVHLQQACWSGRYGEEAARTVIEYAFTQTRVEALMARHHPENGYSRALVSQLGFLYARDEFWEGNGQQCPTYRLQRA